MDDGRPLELADLGALVSAAAADAGLKRYSLVGFSLGAAVAAEVAARQPDRVDALVMVAPAKSGMDGRAKHKFELWRDLSERDTALLARLWLLTGFTPAFLAAIPADQVQHAATFHVAAGIGRQCELYTRIDLSETLPAIRACTHVVGCTYDWIAPPAHARAVAAEVPGSSYTELDSGHMVVFEAADDFAKHVTALLG